MKLSFISLAVKSLMHRKFATAATVFSLVLSLVLLFSIERIRRSVQENFTQTISGVDLIVGARTGSLQLVLYSVFNIGQATNNITYESYKKISERPEVEWTIPYSLGDGHKGFRVVATNNNFFKYYHYRQNQNLELAEGLELNGYFGAVLGAQVAEALNYNLGSSLVLAHGSTTGESFEHHDDKPFKVVGILKATGTAIDRSIYISLEGMEAIHISGPVTASQIKPDEITSFFVKLKNKVQILNLQREITNDTSEAMLAVIPAVVLSELWQSLSQIEFVLKLISSLVMIVGLIGMMIALMTSLNERRREMAILRALGASLKNISQMVILEIILILSTALVMSAAVKVILEISLKGYLKKNYGLFLSGGYFNEIDLLIMAITLSVGLFFSIIPVLVFKNKALKDGLTVK